MLEVRLIFMALVCLCIAQLAFASDIGYSFQSVQDQQRYEKLLKGTRCVICQNQSLFESNSAPANDMRQLIYTMINNGASDAKIQTFLRDRYGDSILFMPPWRLSTLLLWLGPAFMLLLAFTAYRRVVKNKLLADSYVPC